MKRLRLIVGLSLLMALTIPTVAYAASKVSFDAAVNLSVIGPAQALGLPFPPMETDAKFKVKKKTGEIDKVRVDTTNELTLSGSPGLLVTGCEPAGSSFCDALNGSTLSSLHDSKADLKDISQVPGGALAGLDPRFALFPDLLLGDLKGKLKGLVTVQGAGSEDVMTGKINLKIGPNPNPPIPGLPDAVYGCIQSLIPFDPAPLPISACQDGDGSLVPLFLNIVDTGKLDIKDTAGAFGDVKKVKAEIDIAIFGANALGILSGKANLEPSGN